MGDDFRLWDCVRRAFRRREFYLPGDGRIHLVAVSSAVQVAAAAAGIALVLLAASGMLATALYRDAAISRAEVLAAARADYWKLLQNLDQLSEGVDTAGAAAGAPGALVRDLLRREMTRFRALFPKSEPEKGGLAVLSRRVLPRLVPDGLILAEAHSRLLRRAEEAEREAGRLAEREHKVSTELAEARNLLAMVESGRLEGGRLINAMTARIGALKTRHAATEERSQRLDSELAAARSELAREKARNQAAEVDRRSLEAAIARLEGQIASYQSTQTTWLIALGTRTQDSISLVESAVAMTGVDVNKLVSRARKELRSAAGGPFIAASVTETGALPEGVDEIATDVGEQVERWEALKRVVRVMPLSAPLDQYLIASGFGMRTDPVNGHKAMHTGLDFNARAKTPVLSTAPGRVVFAGWRRDYGRLVEIDHGFGIHTRYAHLAAISVKRGEEVAHRAELGLLGSSGRSTGPHLHYEVLVDGKPMNPTKFLEAARHVLKG